MRKEEVLEYLKSSKNTEKNKGGNGTVKLLAEMLGVTPGAVSQYDLIPIKNAVKLDRIFNNKEERNKYGLLAKGRPVLDYSLYD